MPVTTRKANADVHPGRVITEGQQPRRSKKQIEDDNARVRAAAHASREEAAAKYRAAVERIALLEDAVAIAEKDAWTHAHRPDLRPGPPRQPQVKEFTKSASGSDEPLELRVEDDNFAEEDRSYHESESEGGGPQSNADVTIGTGDFSRDDDEAAPQDECDGNTGQIHSSDDEHVTPARHSVKKKEVSLHFKSLSAVTGTDWYRMQQGAALEKK